MVSIIELEFPDSVDKKPSKSTSDYEIVMTIAFLVGFLNGGRIKNYLENPISSLWGGVINGFCTSLCVWLILMFVPQNLYKLIGFILIASFIYIMLNDFQSQSVKEIPFLSLKITN